MGKWGGGWSVDLWKGFGGWGGGSERELGTQELDTAGGQLWAESKLLLRGLSQGRRCAKMFGLCTEGNGSH